MSFVDYVDFCIKTWKRPKSLARLLASIHRFYPSAHVTVNADQDIAAGRNAMVDATKRPYLLFLDDDFEFTEETRLENLFHATATSATSIGYHIASGVVMDWCSPLERVERQSGGGYSVEDGVLNLYRTFRDTEDDIEVVPMRIVPNFFLACRSVFDRCRWRFGIGAEHTDFFMQASDNHLFVAQVRTCRIDHHPFTEAEPTYKQDRWGPVQENQAAFMRHWGLRQVRVNGKPVHTLV